MFFVFLTVAFFGDPHPGTASPNLSPEIRALLIEEMKLLEASVTKIPALLARGELYPVAVEAHQMQDSFVLKKKLTPEQKKKLHRELSPAFLQKDQRFHALAGKLHDAALAGDAELTAMFFGRLLESYISCHTDHASRRFPKLQSEAKATHHH